MPTVDSVTFSKAFEYYVEKQLLETLHPELYYYQFGSKEIVPLRSGKIAKWRRPTTIGKGRVLTESAAGTARGLSASTLSAQMVLFGDHSVITTLLEDISLFSIIDEFKDEYAYAMKETLDFMMQCQILWTKTATSAALQYSAAGAAMGTANKLSAIGTFSASQFNAPIYGIDDLTTRNHAASALNGGTSGTPFTPLKVRDIVLKLKRRNVPTYDGQNYLCIAHPTVLADIRSTSAFQDIVKYTDAVGRIFKGEIGRIEGVRFVETTNQLYCTVTNGAAGASAHGNGYYFFSLFFGRGFFGVSELKGRGSVEIVVKRSGPQSVSDPLSQRNTLGYKGFACAKVLNLSCGLWIVSGKPMYVAAA